MILYLNVKKTEIMTFSGKEMKLEAILINEMRLTQKLRKTNTCNLLQANVRSC